MRSSKASARGVLKLTITNTATGEVTTDVGYNKLTNAFMQRIVDAFRQSPPPDDVIIKVGVGEGDAEPEPTDTGLTNEFIKPVSNIDSDTPFEIVFDFTIQSGDANGLVITEFGLFTGAEVLMARRTRPPLTKTSDIVIDGTWTISFTTQ